MTTRWIGRGTFGSTMKISVRRCIAHGALPAIALMALLLGQAALAASMHTIPLVPPASNTVQQGFIRIINHSDRAGTVLIRAIDDSGERFGPVSMSLNAKTTVHLTSRDLEQGNSGKGLSEGFGDGHGNWRLELESDLDIEPLAHVRTAGLLIGMQDVVAEEAPMRYRVPTFNPGSNSSRQSRLRLINPNDSDTEVTITGLDDQGMSPPEGDVRLTLPAGEAHTITAQQLESGHSTLSGRFGDGAGKWQLFVSAYRSIQVMNLLLNTADGNLTNLSRTFCETPDPETPDPGTLDPGTPDPETPDPETPDPETPAVTGCVNSAAFSAFVLGKRIRTDSSEIRFMEGSRFRETFFDYDTSLDGSYTYGKTGQNTATMRIQYDWWNDDNQWCDVSLNCTSPTAGTFRSNCSLVVGSTTPRSERWTIIP